MKYNRINNSVCHQPIYPNAADEGYFARKALEILMAIVTGTGTVTAMVFLVMLS